MLSRQQTAINENQCLPKFGVDITMMFNNLCSKPSEGIILALFGAFLYSCSERTKHRSFRHVWNAQKRQYIFQILKRYEKRQVNSYERGNFVQLNRCHLAPFRDKFFGKFQDRCLTERRWNHDFYSGFRDVFVFFFKNLSYPFWSCSNPHIGPHLATSQHACIYIYIYPGELPHYPPWPHFRFTPLPTRELPTHINLHCKNRYLAGFGPVPAVHCGFWNYVGSGDGIPQHARGGSEKTTRSRHRGWIWFLEVEFWCRGANNTTL